MSRFLLGNWSFSFCPTFISLILSILSSGIIIIKGLFSNALSDLEYFATIPDDFSLLDYESDDVNDLGEPCKSHFGG